MVQRRDVFASLCAVATITLSGCLDAVERLISRVDNSTFCIVRRDGTERVAVTYNQVASAGQPDHELSRGYYVEVRLSLEGVNAWSAAIEELGGYENPDEIRAEFYAEGRSVLEGGFSDDYLRDIEGGSREFVLAGMDRVSDAESLASAANKND